MCVCDDDDGDIPFSVCRAGGCCFLKSSALHIYTILIHTCSIYYSPPLRSDHVRCRRYCAAVTDSRTHRNRAHTDVRALVRPLIGPTFPRVRACVRARVFVCEDIRCLIHERAKCDGVERFPCPFCARNAVAVVVGNCVARSECVYTLSSSRHHIRSVYL